MAGRATTAALTSAGLWRATVSVRAVRVSGPAEQGTFLLRMGIQARMQALLRSVRTAEQARGLVASYERLVKPGDAGMGSIYKVRPCVGRPWMASPCG